MVEVALVVVAFTMDSETAEELAWEMKPDWKVWRLVQVLMPPRETQVAPVPETSPMPDTWRHWVEPLPVFETKSWEVEAVPETESEVVVAWVPVALVNVKFCRVVDELARSVWRLVSPLDTVRPFE